MKPNPIPADPGCLVQRVLQPTSEFETNWMSMGIAVWRCTLWVGGALHYIEMTGRDEPPSLAELLDGFHQHGFGWAKTPPWAA